MSKKSDDDARTRRIQQLRQARRGLVRHANAAPDQTTRGMAYVRIQEIDAELRQLGAGPG